MNHRRPCCAVLLVAAVLCVSPAPAQKAPARTFAVLAAEAEQARVANRIEDATALYRQAVGLRPSWTEGWWYLGTLLYERDAYAEAGRAFRKATALNAKLGSAWLMLGLCEYKLGRKDEALKHLQRGRRQGVPAEPQFRRVMLYHEGLLLLERSEFEKAQETLGDLARDGAAQDDVVVALGLSVLRMLPKDLPRDHAAMQRLVRQLGNAERLAAQSKFEEAQREYEQAAADLPQQLNVHYALGRFLLTSRHPDTEKAVAAFQREIENHPGHVLARLAIASARASTDPLGGLPYAEEAVRLNPHLPMGRYLLGSLLLHTDQTARAIAELEAAQRALPGEPRVYFALGRAYARANRKQDAARARATFKRLSAQQQSGAATLPAASSQESTAPKAQLD